MWKVAFCRPRLLRSVSNNKEVYKCRQRIKRGCSNEVCSMVRNVVSGLAGWALAPPEFGSQFTLFQPGGRSRLCPPHHCLPTQIWKPNDISSLMGQGQQPILAVCWGIPKIKWFFEQHLRATCESWAFFSWNSSLNVVSWSQCARTDLNKRFLPKPMTTTGWKVTP